MALLSAPGSETVDRMDKGRLVEVSRSWRNFFTQIYNVSNALTLSGLTADRPSSFLWIGRPYFDETLTIPIWVQSMNPTIWCDATGAPV